MYRVVDAKRVQNRSDFAPDLVRVDPELVEKGLLVVKVGGATAADGGAGVNWSRGGGRRGGSYVEGHEWNAGVRLEWRCGHAPLLEVWCRAAGISGGGESHRRDFELFIGHGIEICLKENNLLKTLKFNLN